MLPSRRALEGERPQGTVLVADLTGPTELSRALAPAAGPPLLDTALQCRMDAVPRGEGTVHEVAGAGRRARGGAPRAHEDHALRACYAALALQAALRRDAADVRRTPGRAVRRRVGRPAGGVLGRTSGNDRSRPSSGVGLTTPLAARLEPGAPPGPSRLTAAPLRLVAGAVRGPTLGPSPVQGLAEPVDGFEVVGAPPSSAACRPRWRGG